MAQVYSASDTLDAYNLATGDILELDPGAGAAAQILSIYIGQDSDVGDAAAEMFHINVERCTTGGSGGAAITGVAHEESSGTAVVVAEFGNTTEATGRTLIFEETANVQAGWFYNPIPEERITLTPSGDSIVVTLGSALADAVDLKVRVTWAEIG